MIRRKVAIVVALGLALAFTAGGCGAGADADENGADSSSPSKTTLRVFAATSLQAVFTDLEGAFERAHEDVDVALTFGGSSGLAAQIDQGAPAHVLATADEATMALVVGEGDARPVVFARNRLTLIVEPGNPRSVRGVRDLGRDDLVVVLCAPAVPCGRLANAALTKVGIADDLEPRSLEENVAGVRSKVALGEADAGIVYATDVFAAGEPVNEVDDPALHDPVLQAVYPIAILDGAPRNAAADWVAFVRGAEGRAALSAAGFLAA